MKFLLVPLLIIGMFVSFTAALIAMLFFTRTVETREDLLQLVLGGPDSLAVFGEFRLREDQMDELFSQSQGYSRRYEELLALTGATQESLATQLSLLQVRQDSLDGVARSLGLIADSTYQARQSESIKELARYYAKIKPKDAAEILQQEGALSDTMVAQLMGSLPPSQMAKIMGSMNPDFAARITSLMQVLAQ